MSNPSPSPSHDGSFHAVLNAVGEKILVGDGLGPEYSQDSSKVLGFSLFRSLLLNLPHSEPHFLLHSG